MKARMALDRANAAWSTVPDKWRQAVDAELSA
jgi:hypothetical protein